MIWGYPYFRKPPYHGYYNISINHIIFCFLWHRCSSRSMLTLAHSRPLTNPLMITLRSTPSLGLSKLMVTWGSPISRNHHKPSILYIIFVYVFKSPTNIGLIILHDLSICAFLGCFIFSSMFCVQMQVPRFVSRGFLA